MVWCIMLSFMIKARVPDLDQPYEATELVSCMKLVRCHSPSASVAFDVTGLSKPLVAAHIAIQKMPVVRDRDQAA